jgi:RNA polymerase sigma-70 factor (ECF subfamily)
MAATRQSLLVRAQIGDERAWKDLADLYRPLIVGWLRYQAVPANEIDDLVQDILLAVFEHLPSFEHSGRLGAFRAWLRTITHTRTCDFWRSRGRPPPARPSIEALGHVGDPDCALHRLWDQEHDRYVLRCLLELMALEFEGTTLEAFRRVVVEGLSSKEVARQLGLTVGAVYAAKSRVLRRLRQEGRGLIDAFG